MTVFLFLLALIFLPGLIWVKMNDKFIYRKPIAQTDMLISAFVFGLVAYLVTFIIYEKIICSEFHIFSIIQNDKIILKYSHIDEIVSATVVAVILAIIWSFLINRQIPLKFMRMIGATSVFDEEDVWDFTFNQNGDEWVYINIRDYAKKRVYSGRVKAWSNPGDFRELLLFDAKVYKFDGLMVYEMRRMYISRPSNDITIEFPYEANTGE